MQGIALASTASSCPNQGGVSPLTPAAAINNADCSTQFLHSIESGSASLLFAHGAPRLLLLDSEVRAAGASGVSLLQSDHATIQGCTFDELGANGIEVIRSSAVAISDSVVRSFGGVLHGAGGDERDIGIDGER